MKIITAQEMRKLDRWAIQGLGIPQIALMENAGRAVAEEAEAGKEVVVVAYKGNNGGDGFVAARHLYNKGCAVKVFLLCDQEEVQDSAKTNLDILRKLNIPIIVKDLEKLSSALKKCQAVIDAIFGIGLSGEISGIAARAIDLVNKSRNYTVIAVDVPSGVNSANGQVAKHTIKADLTVTFAYPKKGLLEYPAVKYVGRLIVADIGIPYSKKPRRLAAGFQDIEYFLPKRNVWTHKGDYGRVLIIAGSKNMSGAAYLTARAAIRSGAGLVYLAVPESIQKLVAPKTREVITIGLPETKEGTLSLKAFAEIKKIKADVAAIGPGLTTNTETKALVNQLIKSLHVACLVLDADGLNCITENPSILKKARSKIIITPHPGEMSRLIHKSVKEIQKDRIRIARQVAKKWDVEVVLKGAYTIVADKVNAVVNSTGNPGMASAGVGDVLTGMIAGFKAQGLTAKEAVYIHGLAGDLAAREKGEYGLIASDIIEKIPYAIQAVC